MTAFRHDGSRLDPMLLRALTLAGERNWRVFPLRTREPQKGKAPALNGWQQAATTDPDEIAELWRKHPRGNVGIQTGEASGFFVFDVDGPEGRASLARLEETHGKLPRTYRVKTGRGEHLYFRMPAGGVGNRAGAWAHIDVRGDGGLTVGAGSVHPDGPTYRATDPTAPVTAAPEWLLAALASPAGGPVATTRSVGVPVADYVAGVIAAEVETLATTRAGGRNDQLNRSACALGHYVGSGQADEGEVFDALLDTATDIGLPEGEARATIRSGLKAGKAEPVRLVELDSKEPADEDAALRVEIDRVRRRREALRIVQAEEAAVGFEPLPRQTLKEALANRPEDPPELVERLHRRGYNTTITAQYKTGKTTLGGNLLRSLADGVPFLGRFAVQPSVGRVGLLNYELTDSDMLRWLDDQGIDNPDRIAILNLRGKPFSLAYEQGRDELVAWCREMGVEALFIDPHRRAFAGFGEENSNDDVNRFTAALDEVKDRAGVTDLFLFVHTGRGTSEAGAERARGATAIDDWADQRWVLTKGEDGVRFFHATSGRMADVDEFRLDYDPATRHLSAGNGNRRNQKVEAFRVEILAALGAAGGEGANTAKLEAALNARKGELAKVLQAMHGRGEIVMELGPRNEKRYWLPQQAPENR